jgi:hypothetical protein
MSSHDLRQGRAKTWSTVRTHCGDIPRRKGTGSVTDPVPAAVEYATVMQSIPTVQLLHALTWFRAASNCINRKKKGRRTCITGALVCGCDMVSANTWSGAQNYELVRAHECIPASDSQTGARSSPLPVRIMSRSRRGWSCYHVTSPFVSRTLTFTPCMPCPRGPPRHCEGREASGSTE